MVISPYEIEYEFSSFLDREGLSDRKDEIDRVLEEYRDVKGGLIPVLQQVQEVVRFLPPEVQDYIALKLNVSSADVFGVVSFYSFFSMEPKGKYVIKVCLGTACYVKGADRIVDKVEREFGIPLGGTTPDKKFTLQGVRCLGACGLAPVVMVNDDTHGLVDHGKIMKILKGYD